MNDDEIDRQLAGAVDAELAKDKTIPLTRTAMRFVPGRKGPAPMPTQDKSQTASDQMAVAVEGLLKLEIEFNELAKDIVGDIKEDQHDRPQVTREGPMIPRLRADAELLARMCIRMHNRIEEIRSLL